MKVNLRNGKELNDKYVIQVEDFFINPLQDNEAGYQKKRNSFNRSITNKMRQ